jgi:hypothetical protein
MFFFLGLMVHVFLVSRSWVGGDQLHLLRLGLDFSLTGSLSPYAKLTGGVGTNPGALLQVLVGAPLTIVPHYQSPLFIVILIHLAALALMLRVILEACGEVAGILTLIVYWLSPWRLYNGGFLWEPAYVFLPAAIHFYSSWKLRDRASISASFLLGLALVTSIQLHNSAFLLYLLTALLVVKKMIRVDRWGFAGGGVVGSLTLIPTLYSLISGNSSTDRETGGFFGAGLVMIYPALKGVLYWFTLGSLDSVRMLNETIFLGVEWTTTEGWAYLPIGVRVLQSLTVASVGLSIFASWWYFRPLWKKKGEESESGAWMRKYALATWIALVVSAALSPQVLQGWQVVIALHAATLPMIAWGADEWRKEKRTVLKRIGIPVYVFVQMLVMLTLAYGHYIFRPDTYPPGVDPQTDTELIRLFPLSK